MEKSPGAIPDQETEDVKVYYKGEQVNILIASDVSWYNVFDALEKSLEDFRAGGMPKLKVYYSEVVGNNILNAPWGKGAAAFSTVGYKTFQDVIQHFPSLQEAIDMYGGMLKNLEEPSKDESSKENQPETEKPTD